MAQAKLSTIRRTYPDKHTLEGSLAQAGYARFPGTSRYLSPYKEKNGAYRTGLDPEALYIQFLPVEEREQEKDRVRQEREELEKLTGLDLSPRSDYYYKIFDSKMGEPSRARRLNMKEDVLFDLSDPEQRITWAWVRVHPDVAPSYDAFMEGRTEPTVTFFISDQSHEETVAFNKRSRMNRAAAQLEDLSDSRRLRVASLLGLPVSFRTSPKTVYTVLDRYIREENSRQDNIQLFQNIVGMGDDNMEVKFAIKEALQLSVYRKTKGKIFEGSVEMFKDEDEAANYLSATKHQDEFLALQEKINAKKKIEVS